MVEDYQENYITGWTKLYRSFVNWEWFTVPNMVHIFIYCLLKANHKNKRWRGIEIKRGSFITSYGNIANETGLTVKKVRTALKNLEKTGEIIRKSGNQNTLITICKYDTYQIFNDEEGKQRANRGQTEGNQRATTKNDKNIKNDKNNTIPSFEIFKNYALEKSEKLNYALDLKKLELKYESWVENKWMTGGKNSRKIKNWKSTLLNTLPYLQKEKNSAQKEKVLTLAQKMKQDYGIN